jgi:hypothetical protein
MSIPSWLPPALAFAAAILAGLGGFLQYKLQSTKSAEVARQDLELRKLVEENRDLTKRVADNDGTNKELIKDIAARSGNSKELRDLIETRSRLLMAEPKITESLISDIISQVPQKAKDYQSMQSERSETIARRTRDYMIAWEPLIKFVLGRFDQSIAQLRERNIHVELQVNEVPLYQAGSNSSYYPREVRYRGLRLEMQYNNAGIDVERFDDAYFFLRLIIASSNKVEIEPLVLRIGEKHAECNGKQFAAPANGIPSRELTDMVQLGIAKAVERLLIVAEADKALK